jgi:hypothetical protein
MSPEKEKTMGKVIRLTEWGVKPRFYLLDEFIKSQCFDLQGNHIMPEDGGLENDEIDSLRSLEVGDKVRLGDPSCTEIYVERLKNGVARKSIEQQVMEKQQQQLSLEDYE